MSTRGNHSNGLIAVPEQKIHLLDKPNLEQPKIIGKRYGSTATITAQIQWPKEKKSRPNRGGGTMLTPKATQDANSKSGKKGRPFPLGRHVAGAGGKKGTAREVGGK